MLTLSMRRFAILALLLSAAFAARAESLRLISPGDRTTLRGGQFATLSWIPEHLTRNSEEWEAFLSVDGGRYYSVRLTPHLNIAIHSFEVLVPNIDSDDVRLLFRTGNERTESITEVPQRLRIRAEAQFVVPSSTAAGGPEPARPHEPRVVIWSMGDHVETTAAPPQISPTSASSTHSKQTTLISRAQRAVSGGQAILPVRTDKIVCPPPLPPQRDLLLQCSRLNV
ncbi:MAG: hypothetical protein DMF58_04075 [Acidobacteria bacterium]|nr:MAG: hypothetical protein DMF58_04075 [Acidobacteriota bacterium]